MTAFVPLRAYLLGYVMLAQAKSIPESSSDMCGAISTEMSWRQRLPDC
jgi:hypothetical protein